jgi:hypothetical protein
MTVDGSKCQPNQTLSSSGACVGTGTDTGTAADPTAGGIQQDAGAQVVTGGDDSGGLPAGAFSSDTPDTGGLTPAGTFGGAFPGATNPPPSTIAGSGGGGTIGGGTIGGGSAPPPTTTNNPPANTSANTGTGTGKGTANTTNTATAANTATATGTGTGTGTDPNATTFNNAPASAADGPPFVKLQADNSDSPLIVWVALSHVDRVTGFKFTYPHDATNKYDVPGTVLSGGDFTSTGLTIPVTVTFTFDTVHQCTVSVYVGFTERVEQPSCT